jgi:hypothetical protein
MWCNRRCGRLMVSLVAAWQAAGPDLRAAFVMARNDRRNAMASGSAKRRYRPLRHIA